MTIDSWQQRVGENYNDSRDETDHEIAMQAEIVDLRDALVRAMKAIESAAGSIEANDYARALRILNDANKTA